MSEAPAEIAVLEADESGGDTHLVDTDLLIEDVSIDGMCGVY